VKTTTAHQEIARTVANLLLDTEAIRFSPSKPFRWASGWLSPIYCDNRITLSYPEVRRAIKGYYAEIISLYFPEVELIAGVATAGIAQAALVADHLGLPMCYVRPKPKDHGMENLIEGKLRPGSKTVVLEDLVSTGGSSIKAAQALSDASAEVMGMVAAFRYGFDTAKQSFETANLTLVSLSDYDTLLHVGLERGLFSPSQLSVLASWRNSPDTWKP
jgi:orotate phosphoribosyltransferase